MIKCFFEGKVGRRYTSTTVQKIYGNTFSKKGDLIYAIRQVVWNMKNTSYGEWCVVTLESGEKILVLIDLKLLEIPQDEKVLLPIGKVISGVVVDILQERKGQFEIQEENISWYVDMIGDWEDQEVGDINVVLRFGIVLVIVFVTLVFILEMYDRRKKEGI